MRAEATLGAVHERALMRQAAEAGEGLLAALRAQGLRVWGCGLLLAFDEGGCDGQSGAGRHDAGGALTCLAKNITQSSDVYMCVHTGR